MDIKRVTPEEAQGLVNREGWVLLDVRSEEEFIGEHPQGSFNVPYLVQQPYGMVVNADFGPVIRATFPDLATKIVALDRFGARSIRAVAELSSLGYKAAVDLKGGFEGERDAAGNVTAPGWKAAGLPVEKGASAGRSYQALKGPIPSSPAAVAPRPPAEAPAQPGGRFADATRTVECKKLGRVLPGLKRRPVAGPLGERIFKEISAAAWEQWVAHSTLLINEYRLNPADPRAQELLLEQCEAYLFGAGGQAPDQYRPS